MGITSLALRLCNKGLEHYDILRLQLIHPLSEDKDEAEGYAAPDNKPRYEAPRFVAEHISGTGDGLPVHGRTTGNSCGSECRSPSHR